VFIVSGIFDGDENIVDKDDLARLYCQIYNGAPWFENWTTSCAINEIDEVSFKDNFRGVVAKDAGFLVGFSWGYRVPYENSSRVDFEKIRKELSNQEIDSSQVFYGADTGIRDDYRRQGLASKLLFERTRKSSFDYVAFRTKNLGMLRIYQRAFGEELFSFPEESSYEGGRVYVLEVKK
jgi:hypothetical protein